MITRVGVLRLGSACLLGFAWAGWHAAAMQAVHLPFELEKRDVSVTGTIVGIPRHSGHKLDFLFRTERLQYEGRAWPTPGTVRLAWYEDSPLSLRAGQRWRFSVRLKRPHVLHNPGNFDYAMWLFRSGIRASGYIRRHPAPEPLGHTATLQSWRHGLWQTLHGLVGERPAAGIVAALVVGERQGITPQQWETLRKTGTNHLMAISGLHIGWVAFMGVLLGRIGARFSGKLLLYLPKHVLAGACGVFAALVYAALAGFSVPTQRAFVMVAAVLVGLMWRRNLPLSYIFGFALFAVLLWSPLAVLSAGLWLSFGAVAVIIYAFSARTRVPWAWARIHGVVALGLTPLLLVWFGQVPWLSPFANLIAVPWMMLVIPPLLAGGLLASVWPEGGQWFLLLGSRAIEWLWVVLDHFAALPYADWYPAPAPGWALLCAGAGVSILLLPRGFPARWVGIVWLLPALVARPPVPAPGEAWFTLLDVGQGLAAVLQTHAHTLVYDTGPWTSPRFDGGKNIVLPFLREQGISRLDRVIVSHADNDHAGGTASLAAAIKIGAVYSGMPGELKVPARACMRGERWEWDGVRFEILHPPPDPAGMSDNNRSCVLKISTAGASVLLTGDIERSVEQRLVAAGAKPLEADILVAPHHGSRSSSSPEFVAAAAPRYALFAVGYRNHFGFPKPDVAARYRRHGAEILTTAESGAIHFDLNAQEVSLPRRYRDEYRRYWHE